MYTYQPMFKQLSPFLKILLLILVILVSLLFINIIGLVIAIPIFGISISEIGSNLSNYTNPELIPLLKYFQILNQFGLFIIPVIAFVLLTERKFWKYLSLATRPGIGLLIVGSLILVSSIPLTGFLAEINQKFDLPDSWSSIEQWMVNSENQANELMKLFLSTSTFGGYLVNMFMIGLVAAAGEELLFRGLVLRLFREWTGNIHLSVFITAIIFSAFHLQFFGFLPRFMLGVFLGYIFVWSGSLWVPVFAHFVYNGFAVTAMYLAGLGSIETDYDSFGMAVPMGYIVSSGIVVALLLYWFYYLAPKIQSD